MLDCNKCFKRLENEHIRILGRTGRAYKFLNYLQMSNEERKDIFKNQKCTCFIKESEKMKSETGRYYVVDTKTGRKFCVEPIDIGNRRTWGDVDPATKKLTGSYGGKSEGVIKEEDSVITEENGFTNIGYDQNPMDYINELLKKSEEKATDEKSSL